MAFIFEGLLEATVILAVVYLCLGVFTYKRLLWVQANSPAGLNTRKLFVMTLLLISILRTMSFISMTLLSLGSVDFEVEQGSIRHHDDDDDSADKDFFNKATVALFDFPDFYLVSAYVLLLIVWAESYLKSRRHWLSARRFQTFWIWTYFLFNVLLYTCQIALYSLLFLPTIDHYVETNLIYLTLSGFNLVMPVAWLCLFAYLTLLFSGFPYSTPAAMMRLGHLNGLAVVWTLTRLGWGIIALSSVLNHWVTEIHKSRAFYSIVLVLIFLVAEVIPIMFSLKHKMIQSLADPDQHPTPNTTPSRALHPPGHYVAVTRHESTTPLLDHKDSKEHSIRESRGNSSDSESGLYHPARTSFTVGAHADRYSRDRPSGARDTMGSQDRPSLIAPSEESSESRASLLNRNRETAPPWWERLNIFSSSA